MRRVRRSLSSIWGHWTFVRDERAGALLEDFFVSSVVAVLVIRLYLRLAAGTLTTQLTVSVPAQVAPADLHFAHMLWGGMLMLVALVMLLAFLSRSATELAAIVGGIGFGAFIDEIGKLITGDNNYFFQPAIALIYVTFVLLFILIRAIQRPRSLPERDAKANALELAKELVMGEGGLDTQVRALALLEQCDPSDPTVRSLRELILQLTPAASRPPHLFARARRTLYRLYQRLVQTWWFPNAVMIFFIVQSISSLYQTLATITWSEALIAGVSLAGLALVLLYALRHRAPSLQTLASAGIVFVAILIAWILLLHRREAPESLADWFQPFVFAIEPGTGFRHTLLNAVGLLQVWAPTLSGVLVIFGVMFLWHSRLAAYRMFHHAVLVSIFLTQVFAFYEDQLLGVIGLLPNLLMLATLRFLIRTSERNTTSGVQVSPASPARA